MIKIAVLFALAVCMLPHTAAAAEAKSETGLSGTTVRMIFGEHEVVVAMDDNPASRDFLTLLPLTAEFTDYAGEEKITYLPRKLNAPNGVETSGGKGDFTYYKPWGNLAVFYKGFGGDSQLAVLGRILSGKEKLAGMRGAFTARIERAE